MMNEARFAGQTAIVTGGGSGIGRAVVERLAREGARVVIFDTDANAIAETKATLAATGATIDGAVVDVSDEGQVKSGIENAASAHGGLDVLVHCAGIVGPNAKKITEVSVDEYDRVYRVNLRASFLVTKYALLVMEPKNYGRILLFASIAGKEGNAGMCCYSSTKAGVIGLVKSVGKEYATTGITVNAIAPAVIRTGLVDAMNPTQVEYMTQRIPMQRCGTLDEVASLSCWVVSREASFNTGFTFDLTGGRATY